MRRRATNLDRCKAAYQEHVKKTGREPSRKELAEAVGLPYSKINNTWEDIIDDYPVPVVAMRRCLGCLKMFESVSVGNRLCAPCKGFR